MRCIERYSFQYNPGYETAPALPAHSDTWIRPCFAISLKQTKHRNPLNVTFSGRYMIIFFNTGISLEKQMRFFTIICSRLIPLLHEGFKVICALLPESIRAH